MKRTLAVLALSLATGTPALAAGHTPTVITVTGVGTVQSSPDRATVGGSVMTTAPSATAAIDANNRSYAAIVAAAMRAGVARSDVTLSYYNVNYIPRPAPPANPQPYERYGYTVTRSFTVQVKRMSSTGTVVDALTRAGATNIGGIGFGLAHPGAARAEAMKRAVAHARSAADSLAKAAGLHVVRIMHISLGGTPGIRPMMLPPMALPAGTPAPTYFDPGNVSTTLEVTAVYEAVP